MEMAKDLGTYVGGGLALLSLAKLSGLADVELDPRSSDFGKIEIAGTRIDFWRGYQQIARTVTQIITGKAKVQSGDILDVDRADVLWRYLRGKLSPSAGVGVNLLDDEDMIGNEVTLTRVLVDTFAPLFAADIYEAVSLQGPKGLLTAPLSFFGVSVSSYPPSRGAQMASRVSQLPEHMRTDASGGPPAERWSQLTEAQQTEAKRHDPEIARLLDEQSEEAEGPSADFIRGLEQRKADAWTEFVRSGNGTAYRDTIDIIQTEARGAFTVILGDRRETDADRVLVNDYFEAINKAGRNFEERDRLDAEFRRTRTTAQNAVLDDALRVTGDIHHQELKEAKQYLDQAYWTPRDNVYAKILQNITPPAPLLRYPTYTALTRAYEEHDQMAKLLKGYVDRELDKQMLPLRYSDPKADAMMYVYGYRTDVLSAQAQAIVAAWVKFYNSNMPLPKVRVVK
jgi:hypothetical protein